VPADRHGGPGSRPGRWPVLPYTNTEAAKPGALSKAGGPCSSLPRDRPPDRVALVPKVARDVLSVGGGPRFCAIAHAYRPPRRTGIKAGPLAGTTLHQHRGGEA